MFSNEKHDLHDLKDYSEHISCSEFRQNVKTGFHYLDVKAGAVIKEEITSRHYIVAILEGDFIIDSGRFKGKKFKGGEMVCIPSLVPFKCTAETNGQLIVFGFNEILSSCDVRHFSVYSSRCAKITYAMEPTPIKYPVDSFFRLLEYYIRNNMSCVHLHELKHREFFMIIRGFYDKDELSHFMAPVITRISPFGYYIYNNYRKHSSVSSLIATSPYSRSVFFRKFKEEFGDISPAEWIKQKQRESIMELATIPNITVKEIMNKLDIGSTSSFQRLCLDLFSCTPKELIGFLSNNQKII